MLLQFQQGNSEDLWSVMYIYQAHFHRPINVYISTVQMIYGGQAL